MKVLMLWKYPPQYLAYFYKKYPTAANLSFKEHRERIFDDYFGWPAGLNRFMNQRGMRAEFIIANAESLQKKWAEENDFRRYSIKGMEKQIAMEQIRRFQPDVLWIGSHFDYYGRFVKEALSYSKKAITWVGSPFVNRADVSGFSVLLTENPNTFRSQQRRFEKVIVTKPGFDPDILKNIGAVEKKYDITFVGGISEAHSRRADILAYLIKNGIGLKIFGFIHELLPMNRQKSLRRATIGVLKRSFVKKEYFRNIETIKSACQDPVFGLEMYKKLAASHITLNAHIDVAGSHAGNMRVFEATGAGACLATDHSDNIAELFEPGKDILTYKTKEELLALLKEMSSQDKRLEQIAQAGQRKTLQRYTIEKMFNDIMPAFNA